VLLESACPRFLAAERCSPAREIVPRANKYITRRLAGREVAALTIYGVGQVALAVSGCSQAALCCIKFVAFHTVLLVPDGASRSCGSTKCPCNFAREYLKSRAISRKCRIYIKSTGISHPVISGLKSRTWGRSV
jgi:hypothetical protein